MTSPLKKLFYSNYYRIEIELPPIGILERQGEAIFSWKGTCHQLKEISQDTFVVTGTDDLVLPSANSMMLIEKIPGGGVVMVDPIQRGWSLTNVSIP